MSFPLWLKSLHSIVPSGGRDGHRPNFPLRDLPSSVYLHPGEQEPPALGGEWSALGTWSCQAENDLSVFPHSTWCPATVRAQAHSVHCSLESIFLWTEVSNSSLTGPCTGLSPQLSDQPWWSPPAVTRKDPTWANISDAHPASLWWLFEGAPAKSAWMRDRWDFRTQLFSDSLFYIWILEFVDFADKRKLLEFHRHEPAWAGKLLWDTENHSSSHFWRGDFGAVVKFLKYLSINL